MNLRLRPLRAILGVLATVAVLGSVQMITAAAPAQAASDFAGCPSGAVCIYEDGDVNHLSVAYITDTYWSYGAHNLVNQFNDHWVVNNQYGGPNATAVVCYGYNGSNCTGDTIPPGWGFVENLTPINSIVLNRP